MKLTGKARKTMKTGWIVAAGAAVALGAAYIFTGTPQGSVTAINGLAMPVGTSGGVFMVTLDLQNDGAPVMLENVTSPSGATVSFMNPNQTGAMVIPGNDTAQLAMDGAHIMLRVAPGEFPEGSFQSLSLGMSDGSEVVTRILHKTATGTMSGMDHSMGNGIDMLPSPKIALAGDPDVKADGFEVEITVENFEFVVVDGMAPHVDGQGHAHIYLNGVKLGRLYENRFEVGGLPAGEYNLTVALNSNDHRPYLSDGAPIAITYRFSL